MKEQIINILIKNKNWVELSSKEVKTAEEINSHVMEFIEWMIFGEGNEFYSDFSNHKFYEFKTDKSGDEILVNPRSLEKMYKYWLMQKQNEKKDQ